jgi:hypothetical protein
MKTLRHHNSNGSAVEVNGNTYVFTPQYNVSLCENIPDEDAELILKIKANVCCGATKLKFRIANANDISIWHTGHLP